MHLQHVHLTHSAERPGGGNQKAVKFMVSSVDVRRQSYIRKFHHASAGGKRGAGSGRHQRAVGSSRAANASKRKKVTGQAAAEYLAV